MCFDWTWFEHLFIWVIVVGAIFGILKILLPMVFAQLGSPGTALVQIINILMWAVIACFVVYIAFAIIECLAGGGMGFGLTPGRR
jgi:hypothetical protein